MDKFLLCTSGTGTRKYISEPNKSTDNQPTTSKSVDSYNTNKSTRCFLSSWIKKFPWLIYNTEKKVALCNVCKTMNEKNILTFSSKIENAFIESGFKNWKKAIERFRIHEMSACHKEAVLKFASIETNVNVTANILSEKLRQMKENRVCLLKIISSLRYLGVQGISIRGHTDERSNFNNLLNLRSEDSVELQKWMNRDSYKWMCHEVQNEILNIMSHSILRKLIQNIKNVIYFSIIADETSDVATKEQFSFCIRYEN